MAYRFQDLESVAAAAPRLLVEQIDGAISELRAGGEEAVHTARKHLKKARAVLRLVRDGLGDKTYRREMTQLRDAGRGLSGVRDAQVARATLEGIAQSAPAADVDQLRAALDARLGAIDQGAAVVDVLGQLEEARQRLGALSVSGKDAKVLRGGVRRVYEQGTERFDRAGDEPTVEYLHAWRKRVKDLWYQLRMLGPAWPEVLDPVADAAHTLSEYLGDDHDLSVLRDVAIQTLEDGERSALVGEIDRRRDELQEAAVLLGTRLYAERPKAFSRRVEAYWQVWQVEARSPGAPQRPPSPAPSPDGQPVRVSEPRIAAPAPGAVERGFAPRPSVVPRRVEPALPAPAIGSRERGPVPSPRPARPSGPQLPPPVLGSVERPTRLLPRPEPVAPEPVTPEPVAPEPVTAPGLPSSPQRTDETPAPVPETPERTPERPPRAAPLVASPTGKRYHRPACTLAGAGAQPIAPNDVKTRNLRPCTVCRPPAPS